MEALCVTSLRLVLYTEIIPIILIISCYISWWYLAFRSLLQTDNCCVSHIQHHKTFMSTCPREKSTVSINFERRYSVEILHDFILIFPLNVMFFNSNCNAASYTRLHHNVVWSDYCMFYIEKYKITKWYFYIQFVFFTGSKIIKQLFPWHIIDIQR